VSYYDPIPRSTDLDSHGLAPAVEADRCAQSGEHGMEAVSCRTWLFEWIKGPCPRSAAGRAAAPG
jgi:hypothetical protein